MLVNAYVIFNATTNTYVGDLGVVITINCERLQAYSPRPCWLVRQMGPGDGTVILYEPTFKPTSDQILDTNTLAGMMIEQDGQDVLIDVANQLASNFQQACDSCCGSVPTIIANTYGGNATAFVPLAISQFCIYRFDDGSAGAHDAFAADYATQYVGAAVMRSNLSGLSHYTLNSYWTLAQWLTKLLGSDTIYVGACGS